MMLVLRYARRFLSKKPLLLVAGLQARCSSSILPHLLLRTVLPAIYHIPFYDGHVCLARHGGRAISPTLAASLQLQLLAC